MSKILRMEAGFARIFARAFGSGSDTALEPRPAQIGRWRGMRVVLAQILRWGRQPRQLHLRESLPLGNHRFVAVVEYEQSRFLLGGTPGSLVLLARLGAAEKIPREDLPPQGPEEFFGEVPR